MQKRSRETKPCPKEIKTFLLNSLGFECENGLQDQNFKYSRPRPKVKTRDQDQDLKKSGLENKMFFVKKCSSLNLFCM